MQIDGMAWINWEVTHWDEPAKITYAKHDNSPFPWDATKALPQFFKENSIGFRGYAINNLDRPSPRDIYDILCKHKGKGEIVDFWLIGPIVG